MIETDNESTRQPQCGHALCHCTVPAGNRFCSDHCAKEAGRGGSQAEGSRCGCAHAACDETAG